MNNSALDLDPNDLMFMATSGWI